jgi:hypothetical protein
MTERAAMRSSQQYKVSGSDDFCVPEVYEGSLLGVNSSSSNSVRQLPRTRSRASEARPPCAYLVPGALVVDPQGYPVRLTAQIAEEATILEKSLDAIDHVAGHISTYGSDTTIAAVPLLLADLADINLALKEHVDQLRVVVRNLRSFEGTCRIIALSSQL